MRGGAGVGVRRQRQQPIPPRRTRGLLPTPLHPARAAAGAMGDVSFAGCEADPGRRSSTASAFLCARSGKEHDEGGGGVVSPPYSRIMMAMRAAALRDKCRPGSPVCGRGLASGLSARACHWLRVAARAELHQPSSPGLGVSPQPSDEHDNARLVLNMAGIPIPKLHPPTLQNLRCDCLAVLCPTPKEPCDTHWRAIEPRRRTAPAHCLSAVGRHAPRNKRRPPAFRSQTLAARWRRPAHSDAYLPAEPPPFVRRSRTPAGPGFRRSVTTPSLTGLFVQLSASSHRNPRFPVFHHRVCCTLRRASRAFLGAATGRTHLYMHSTVLPILASGHTSAQPGPGPDILPT